VQEESMLGIQYESGASHLFIRGFTTFLLWWPHPFTRYSAMKPPRCSRLPFWCLKNTSHCYFTESASAGIV